MRLHSRLVTYCSSGPSGTPSTRKFREHVSTLLLQQALAEPEWAGRLTAEDRRALTVLFWSNINPYGTFRLDMDKRLELPLCAVVPGPRRAAEDAARPAGVS
ncbi:MULTISPECIES: Tn3 family transposase [Streptomyces violaceusniger group]|uniref:Transposase n=2 Tax=Streptomyces rhizosphaericus TaxID=114699 RepID=A0ABN1SSF5_9ACTN|nr:MULTISPECIES: Tn3 family transposase [Streptomyces violaceusniger group]